MRNLLITLLSVFLIVSVAGCSKKQNLGNNDKGISTEKVWGITPFEQRQTLRIGFFTGSPLSYPFLFADKLGIFDKLNIDVKYTCFTGGPAMMEANAEWDVASCGVGGLVNGLYGYDFSLVDITDLEENTAIFVRPDSDIAKDPENPTVWKGKKCVYPAGTTAQAVLAKYLNNIGLTLADVESINMDNSNALTGFRGGTGDVLGCWQAIAFSAEDAGFIRITDAGKIGFAMPCGTFAKKDIMKNKFDLVMVACTVFHLATEWCYESDANMQQAITWYLEHCDEEGFLCNADIAKRTMDWYHGPTFNEWIDLYTKTSPDDAGLYTTRDLLLAEKYVLSGLDFFISAGKYTNADRKRYLDDRRVDPSVALAAKQMLKR